MKFIITITTEQKHLLQMLQFVDQEFLNGVYWAYGIAAKDRTYPPDGEQNVFTIQYGCGFALMHVQGIEGAEVVEVVPVRKADMEPLVPSCGRLADHAEHSATDLAKRPGREFFCPTCKSPPGSSDQNCPTCGNR